MSAGQTWRGSVEMVRRAATAKGRERSGYFSIEGIRLHERALRAGWQVESAVLGCSFRQDMSPRIQTLLRDLEASGSSLVDVPDEVIVELTDGRDLGAIIGLLRRPDPPVLREVVSDRSGGSPLLLVADGIKDPGNTGALMRTALAAGANAFIACGISDPYHPKAVRTSMGSLFKLPVLAMSDTRELLVELSALRIQSLGLAVNADLSITQAAYSEQGVAILVGSEARGLAPETLEALDSLVSIPMRDGVDSYSVNAAAAIALYELGRRRPDNRQGPDLPAKD